MFTSNPLIDRNGLLPEKSETPSSVRQLDNLQELNYQHLLYFWAVARDGSIADACERLQLSQPTISMQIRKLEKMLGHRLFDRSGRKLVLTEIGHTVYDYADEMFSLGRELLGVRGMPGKRSGRLHVGIPTFLPKVVTYRLLEPVLHLPNQVQLICHEDDMADLIDGLARHRFDVILTDTPIHSASTVRTFNHPLGKCDIAVCGVPALADRYRARFPESLDGRPPFLLPTMVTQLRRVLERWFDEQPFQPRIVGEFDDSALMKEFGKAGAGLFTIPSAVVPEVMEQYGLELVGRIPNLTVSYFAVTTERKLTHPATIVIAERSKTGLLANHQ